MKELEYAGFVGYPIVLALAFSIFVRAIANGMPAIANGQLAPLGFTSASALASSVSTWAFAFYIQVCVCVCVLCVIV